MKKLKIERTAKRAKIKKFDNLTILVLACIILKKLNSPTKSQVIDFRASLELFLELNNVILTLIGCITDVSIRQMFGYMPLASSYPVFAPLYC